MGPLAQSYITIRKNRRLGLNLKAKEGLKLTVVIRNWDEPLRSGTLVRKLLIIALWGVRSGKCSLEPSPTHSKR